jgi:hypothetical protein
MLLIAWPLAGLRLPGRKAGHGRVEFLSITGRSNVVALPGEIEPAGLVARLREIGYPVESAL